MKRKSSRRNRIKEKLRESEERFALFINRLPGGAWIKDAKGRYVYTNKTAAEKIFRKPQSDLIGKTDEEIFRRIRLTSSKRMTGLS